MLSGHVISKSGPVPCLVELSDGHTIYWPDSEQQESVEIKLITAAQPLDNNDFIDKTHDC